MLKDGEFYQLENCWSEQEGALTVRTGHRVFLGGPSDTIVALGKLNLGGPDSADPRYRGDNTLGIARYLPNSGPATVVRGDAVGGRWTEQQYYAGASGIPAAFFATPTGSYRDNGSYALLQNWGIDPPAVPAVTTPYATQLIIAGLPATPANRFLSGITGNSSGQKTVSFISAVPGYTQITPTAAAPTNGLDGIYTGMLVTINDSVAGNETMIVSDMDDTSLYGFTTIAHVAANVLLTASQTPITTANGAVSASITGLDIDASFSGIAQDGYSSDDLVHVGVYISNVSVVTDFRIRIVPNFTGSPYATDYYEKEILPSSITAYVSPATGSATPTTALSAIQQVSDQLNSGIGNQYRNANEIINQIQPQILPPTAVGATVEVWAEFDIPKSQFAQIGNAGSGAYTWKNINQIYIYTVATGAATVKVSSIYFAGGSGLDSSSAGTLQYDYLYAYRNPNSNFTGNPSQLQIPANIAAPIKARSLAITCAGIDNSAGSGNSEISGTGSIAVYRQGGTFADGLYRLVGYAVNPGVDPVTGIPNTVVYIDNSADSALDQADILEFDNNPPVYSSLSNPLIANITGFQPQGGGAGATVSASNATNRIILGSLPAGFGSVGARITVGSALYVGTGQTSETCIVSAVPIDGGSWLEVYTQFPHNITSADASETVECDAINRGNCDLACQEFDSLFLAGDPNNPHVLYQSKVGRPESFPVIVNASGVANQVNVGSPADPILGVTSLNSQLVCLNQSHFYIVNVWSGQMQPALQSEASRGLFQKFCWCKADGAIFYLAYDGVYVWSGGASEKLSESIEYMFRGQIVNGIAPINMAAASQFSFAYSRGNLFVCYQDINGDWKRLRLEVASRRWHVESLANKEQQNLTLTAAYVEEDTGYLLFGVAGQILWADFVSTTDGWENEPNDGSPINYTAWRYWPLSGDMGVDTQVGEVLLELICVDLVNVSLYYNYSTSATETFTVPAEGLGSAVRERFARRVNSGTPQTAYSIGLKIYGFCGESTPVSLFTFSWRAFDLELITTGPDSDWMDLGHPYDKLFEDVTVEYDLGGLPSINVFIDTLSGLSGGVVTEAALVMALAGPGRAKQQFIFPDQTIAKMVKVRPQYNASLQQFKFWNIKFNKKDYPPDSLVATPWSNEGYPYDKIFSSLAMELDTNGVPAAVAFQVDGQTLDNLVVSGTWANRAVVTTLRGYPASFIGKEWRIVPTSVPGGKFQLFSVNVNYQKEPIATEFWDSLEQSLGFVGWKMIKQIWVEYVCPVSILFTIFRDDYQFFYQVQLPPHTNRDIERFYVPAYSNGEYGLAPQPNKSKIYRFVIEAVDGASPVKLYRDGSRVESRQLSGDQRGGYEQHELWHQMPLPI